MYKAHILECGNQKEDMFPTRCLKQTHFPSHRPTSEVVVAGKQSRRKFPPNKLEP